MARSCGELQTERRSLFSLHSLTARTLAWPVLIGLVIGWVYAATFAYLMKRWSVDPEYSHGYLVPIFSLVILWYNRSTMTKAPGTKAPGGPSWWALVPLAAGAALYVVGTYFYFTWLVQLSLIPILLAVCLALGGWPAFRWAWSAIVFLLFMIPLPARLDSLLASPLQRCATLASTNALQTLGFFAHAEGNVILMSQAELGVVEACSGLRMLMVFFAASTAVALIKRRSLPQTGLILLSAVPIALLCNVIRITLTGVFQEIVSNEAADFIFHDVAGWLMIPMALLFLSLELTFLSHLFVPKESERVDTEPVGQRVPGLRQAASAPLLSPKS